MAEPLDYKHAAPELCESCGKRPPRVRVKHYQTSRHWRCWPCLRALVSEAPVVVSGWALPTRSHATILDLKRERKAACIVGKHEAAHG